MVCFCISGQSSIIQRDNYPQGRFVSLTKFEKQKKFKNCKDKQLLSFDFYLIDYNICVEFDGRHHFETIDYWGGEEKLKYTQKHDKMKNIYCKKNNIKLIRIKHDIKFNKIVEIFEKIKI